MSFVNYSFFSLEYLDMESMMAISKICIISEVPPELKNGKEIPVLGILLVTTAIFIAT